MPNREVNFDDKAHVFQAHSKKLADTAKMVAAAGGSGNKRTVEGIHAAAQLVSLRIHGLQGPEEVRA